VLLLGGLLYTIGAVMYATRWRDPWPAIFGFHDIFHVFVVAGTAPFANAIWIWALPFPRG
jgi:hemolysin III